MTPLDIMANRNVCLHRLTAFLRALRPRVMFEAKVLSARDEECMPSDLWARTRIVVLCLQGAPRPRNPGSLRHEALSCHRCYWTF